MPQARHDVIPGFTCVAPAIWEYIPTLSSDPYSEKFNANQAPSLILLFSWTGAHGRHIAKYAAIYKTYYPTSRIMIITTSAIDLAIRTSKSKQERLKPAVQRILSYGVQGSVLMHAFSEGGSHKAVEFAEAYYNTTGTQFPVSALCMDSTPGHPRYLRFVNALAKSFPPHPVFRYLGLFISAILLGCVWFLYCCFKGYNNNIVSRTRRRIMDPTYWDLSIPRCYLYGEADAMIAWRDIDEHAINAMEMGIPVINMRFQNSDHCKHALDYPDQYWNAVKLTWKRAIMKHMNAPKIPELVLKKGGWSEVSSCMSEVTLWSPTNQIGVAL